MNERIKIKTKATQPIIKKIEEIQLHLFESIYFFFAQNFSLTS